MTALTEFLFPAPARRRTVDILRWWEGRRLHYNLIVGGAGVLSLAMVQLMAWLPPYGHGTLGLPWQPVVVFGVMANVCYTLGPLVEMALSKLWGGRVLPAGPTLFRMGLTFSVGLALLPSLLAPMEWLFRVAQIFF